MSDLIIPTHKTGDGRTLATINGKTYNLLAGYQHYRAGGWFFLAVAGRTALKKEDLDEHWDVVRAGDVSVAYAQRPFSYHLCQSGENGPPLGCSWPRLQRPPEYYAIVAPTTEGVEHLLQLVLEQYWPQADPAAALKQVLDKAVRVADVAGQGPEALLVQL